MRDVARRLRRCGEQQRLCLARYRALSCHARRYVADVGLLLDAPQYGLSEPEELQSPADHFRRVRGTVAFGDRILPAVQKLQPRRLPLAPQAPQTSCDAKRRLTRQSSIEKAADSSKIGRAHVV